MAAKTARSKATPTKENGVSVEEGLSLFKSDKFDVDAYVQSKFAALSRISIEIDLDEEHDAEEPSDGEGLSFSIVCPSDQQSFMSELDSQVPTAFDDTNRKLEVHRETGSALKTNLKNEDQPETSLFRSESFSAILKSSARDDTFDELLPEGFQLVSFSEDASASSFEGLDLYAEEWYNECLNDAVTETETREGGRPPKPWEQEGNTSATAANMNGLQLLQQNYGSTMGGQVCLLLFSYELHRQLRLLHDSHHVSVIAADPGFVKTNIMHELPCYITSMVFLGSRILGFLQLPDDGAESIIDAALSTPETSGAYYFGGKGRTIESSQVSKDPKLAKQLWDTSCALFNDLQLLHHN